MSLHNAAKYLESKGRNGDSMLVHMTPGEVKGLQALALAQGGSLSINPNTGLVEANFLKRILPMVAGAALTGLSGGAINPLTASMLVGGFETARTGDLSRGLMAGLGAYGGSGLTQGLSTAGAQSLGTAGPQMTPIATENVGANILKEGVGLGGTTSVPTTNVAADALRSTAPAPVTGANFRAGIGQLGSEAGRSAVYQALPKMTLPAAGLTLASAATPEYAPPGPMEPDEYDRRLAAIRLSPNFTGYTPPQPNPYYTPRGLGYAAEGGSTGDIMLRAGGDFDDQPGETAFMASGGVASYANQGQVRHLPRRPDADVGIFRDTDPDTARKDSLEAALVLNKKAAAAAALRDMGKLPKTNLKGLGDIPTVAEGGSIGGYSDGGRMLKGPGDGMSDSIPATIGKRQPARLADGEFVVPADVVSHLGNGSTDAGAKRLYAMMDKVRKARTGTKKQGKKINAEKFIPGFAEGGVPSSDSAGLASLAALGREISGRGSSAEPSRAPVSQAAYDSELQSRLASAAASRPAREIVKLAASERPAMDYSNIRPDMLMDPSRAGWRPAIGYEAMLASPSLTLVNQNADKYYTDSNGNVWVRT